MEKKVSTSPVSMPPVGPKASTAVIPTVTGPVAAKPMEKHEMKKWCHDHKYRYVLVHTKDGWCCDGFVEHIDDENVCLAIPCCGPGYDPRGFVPFTPFVPFSPFYPAPFFPRRRFIRQVFPLAALIGLSLLPFYW